MDAKLPDERLERLVEHLSKAPLSGLPQACGSVHEAKAADRFWGNERVRHEAIIAVQRAETLLRLKGEDKVLLVQDTTSVNFSHHPATAGLGPLENEHCRGFLAHSTLAVSRVGVPLGLLEQQVWVRRDEDTGKRHQRHERPFEQKESYKWVKGLPKAEARDSLGYVVVCDAEAHIYEFLDEMMEQSLDFIVRAADARGFTEEGQALFDAIAQHAVQHPLHPVPETPPGSRGARG